MALLSILVATVAVSLLSLVGVLLLPFNARTQQRLLFILIAFATGALLGAAFFDLLPEAGKLLPQSEMFAATLAGILGFFVIEKLIHWHHHQGDHHSDEKPLALLNIVGGSVHNFFDGVAISAAFLSGPAVGVATTLAVVFHEIPREFGDYGLLLFSGMSRRKALFFNFLSGLVAVLGALTFYAFSSAIVGLQPLALSFTAGSFIYIASANLLPEFQKETEIRKSLAQFLFIVLGVAFIGTAAAFFG